MGHIDIGWEAATPSSLGGFRGKRGELGMGKCGPARKGLSGERNLGKQKHL